MTLDGPPINPSEWPDLTFRQGRFYGLSTTGGLCDTGSSDGGPANIEVAQCSDWHQHVNLGLAGTREGVQRGLVLRTIASGTYRLWAADTQLRRTRSSDPHGRLRARLAAGPPRS